MAKRLINQTYVLTVEGECEKYYFEHLKMLINNTSNRIANCQFKPDIAIKKTPSKYSKNFVGVKNRFFHIQDIEDYFDEFHRKNFLSLIEDVQAANKYVNYKLGYTNYSFELWILLHKRDMSFSVSDRTKYLPYINKSYNTKYEHLDEYKEENNFKYVLSKITLNDVIEAVNRAKQIRECNENRTCCAQNQKKIDHCKYSFYRANPDLDIHEVVEIILVECLGKNYVVK